MKELLNYAQEHADQILTVANPRAMECSRNLAQLEGIFVGISAGATLAAALEIAESAPVEVLPISAAHDPDDPRRHPGDPIERSQHREIENGS